MSFITFTKLIEYRLQNILESNFFCIHLICFVIEKSSGIQKSYPSSICCYLYSYCCVCLITTWHWCNLILDAVSNVSNRASIIFCHFLLSILLRVNKPGGVTICEVSPLFHYHWLKPLTWWHWVWSFIQKKQNICLKMSENVAIEMLNFLTENFSDLCKEISYFIFYCLIL